MVWQKLRERSVPVVASCCVEKGNKTWSSMDEQCGYVKNKPTEEEVVLYTVRIFS